MVGLLAHLAHARRQTHEAMEARLAGEQRPGAGHARFPSLARSLGQVPPTVGDRKRDAAIAALYQESLRGID